MDSGKAWPRLPHKGIFNRNYIYMEYIEIISRRNLFGTIRFKSEGVKLFCKFNFNLIKSWKKPLSILKYSLFILENKNLQYFNENKYREDNSTIATTYDVLQKQS